MNENLKMSKAKKFTFKNHKRETGLGAIGYPNPDIDIRLNKKNVGLISASSWQKEDYSVGFMVIDSESAGGWKWIFLKKRTKNADEMKTWLNEVFTSIIEKYPLREAEI